ncbi:hypothetical protein M413DRAFT_446759 [Hebeloma cylindrosporum]|uniref:Uncharacterized protein n=1 Tax=Hebeloma cylindrosporum TaxID=76867 RepID=A0A0C3C8C7_HEBCY|nr:hypothetical protein M413DRAFT_446759 [Hebeloma cylindrosporum h7]
MFSIVRRSPMRAAALTPRCNSTRLYSSTTHANDPKALEREKQRDLDRKQNKQQGREWNEALASASEAAVKADRSEEDPSELPSKTIESLRVQHSESETENGDGSSSTTAFYSRDEVSGPLSGAVGKEEKQTPA